VVLARDADLSLERAEIPDALIDDGAAAQISETFDRATFCPLPGFLLAFFSAFLPAFVSIFLSLFDSLSFFGIFVRPMHERAQ
jgi:hypothetical protein